MINFDGDRQSGVYNPKIHRKLYQNANPFVLRKYDGRIKRCCACKIAFKDVATNKFVIAHKELYVYGRVYESKRLHMAKRDFFYHIDQSVYDDVIRTSTCATSQQIPSWCDN